MVDRLAVGQRLQGDLLAEPGAQHALRRRRGEVAAVAAARVVGVRVGDDRALDRPPRVDVEVARRAVQAFRALHDQVFARHGERRISRRARATKRSSRSASSERVGDHGDGEQDDAHQGVGQPGEAAHRERPLHVRRGVDPRAGRLHRIEQVAAQLGGEGVVANEDVGLARQQQAERVEVRRADGRERALRAVEHRHLGVQEARLVLDDLDARAQQHAVHRPAGVVLHEVFVAALQQQRDLDAALGRPAAAPAAARTPGTK